MNSFQEWSEQLSKKAPITIPLHRIAVAPDNSYGKLMSLLEQGYDRVKWVLVHENGNIPCPLCQQIANEINGQGGISLAAFLGLQEIKLQRQTEDGETVDVPPEEDNRPVSERYSVAVPIYKDAPIYNWSHISCQCLLQVYRSSDSAVELVSAEG